MVFKQVVLFGPKVASTVADFATKSNYGKIEARVRVPFFLSPFKCCFNWRLEKSPKEESTYKKSPNMKRGLTRVMKKLLGCQIDASPLQALGYRGHNSGRVVKVRLSEVSTALYTLIGTGRGF